MLTVHFGPPEKSKSNCPASAAEACFLQTALCVRVRRSAARDWAPVPVLPPALEKAEPGVELFLARVGRAPDCVLILDFEATLAPLTVGGRTAETLPEMARILRAAMAVGVRVAILGKGPVATLEKALAALRPRPELWGRDGLERLSPDGSFTKLSRPRSRRLRSGGGRDRISRRLVVRRLLREAGADTALALLGGVANEQAFDELFGQGLSGLIATRRRASCADVWIRSGRDLMAFLHRWTRAVRSQQRLARRAG